jgi:hypothetical protein
MLGASATTRMPRQPPARQVTIHGRRMPHRDAVRSLILPNNGLPNIASQDRTIYQKSQSGGYRAAAAASDCDTLLPPIRTASALPDRVVVSQVRNRCCGARIAGPVPRCRCGKGAGGRYEVVAGLRAMKTSSRAGRSGAPRASVSPQPAGRSESSITGRGG